MIFAAGAIHLAIVAVALYIPVMLDWRRSLRPLDPFMRRLVWVYGVFVGLTVASFGVVSLLNAEALVGGGTLARTVCGVIAVFWAARMVVQLLVFRRPAFVTGWFRTTGYHGLTVAIAYLIVVYGWAAIAPG
jgi:hypothetical protein